MDKTVNQKAWFLVLPVLMLVAFSAVIPLMTVVNYSVQDTFGNNQFFWAGLEWFEEMLNDGTPLGRAWAAIDVLGHHPADRDSARCIFVALNMPKKGFWASFCLVFMSLPLLIPWNVVGTIWQVFGRVDIGLLGHTLAALGIDYNYTNDPFRGLGHDHRDGCLALDVAGGAFGLCRSAIHPGRLLSGGQD